MHKIQDSTSIHKYHINKQKDEIKLEKKRSKTTATKTVEDTLKRKNTNKHKYLSSV